MKMNKFFLAFCVAALAFVSCEKTTEEGPNNDRPAEQSAIDGFCGTYDLTIETDSVCNGGTWLSNSVLPEVARIPVRTGRLTISKNEGQESVSVLGRIVVAGDSVDYYRTTGTLDANGNLQLESGQPYAFSLHTNTFTFSPMKKGSTIVFKVDATYVFNGTTYIERATNTAIKRWL